MADEILMTDEEIEIAETWFGLKCPQCTERFDCLSKENKKIFRKKMKSVNTLGFCEDYIVDLSQLPVDNLQVCHEEITFKELFNRGIFPIDPEEKICEKMS
jgi:hypothetical protein